MKLEARGQRSLTANSAAIPTSTAVTSAASTAAAPAAGPGGAAAATGPGAHAQQGMGKKSNSTSQLAVAGKNGEPSLPWPFWTVLTTDILLKIDFHIAFSIFYVFLSVNFYYLSKNIQSSKLIIFYHWSARDRRQSSVYSGIAVFCKILLIVFSRSTGPYHST